MAHPRLPICHADLRGTPLHGHPVHGPHSADGTQGSRAGSRDGKRAYLSPGCCSHRRVTLRYDAAGAMVEVHPAPCSIALVGRVERALRHVALRSPSGHRHFLPRRNAFDPVLDGDGLEPTRRPTGPSGSSSVTHQRNRRNHVRNWASPVRLARPTTPGAPQVGPRPCRSVRESSRLPRSAITSTWSTVPRAATMCTWRSTPRISIIPISRKA